MKIDDEASIKYLEENYGKNILPLSIGENKYFVGSRPLDLLLFYKKNTSILKLQDSFLKAAEHYNLFSSRLIMIGQNKFALQYCTDAIKINILPPINETFDNINIDDVKKMIVPVKTLPGEPLVAITGIPIKDGVFGGISCSHAITDGIALMLFLYAWSCIIEDRDFLLPSPKRLFKGNPLRSDKIDKVFIPPLSELSDEIQNRVKSDHVKTYAKREYFSDEFLNEIKNKAKSENAEYNISDHQIMTSFLLKKYHNYILPDTDKLRSTTPFDIREIHPDIDSMYIGNAVCMSYTEFTKDEIDKMSIYEIANRLKKSINSVRNENYIKKIIYLSKYGIEWDDDFINSPASDTSNDIVSVNLTHFNDLESMFLGPDIGSILYISSPAPNQTSFVILKEKSGRIFAEITGRYPLT